MSGRCLDGWFPLNTVEVKKEVGPERGTGVRSVLVPPEVFLTAPEGTCSLVGHWMGLSEIRHSFLPSSVPSG